MSDPTRVTVIPADNLCAVDGVGFNGVDMASVPPEIHAVQWYGVEGEEEIVDLTTRKIIRNNVINSLSAYKAVLDSYWKIRDTADAALQELVDEQTIVEV